MKTYAIYSRSFHALLLGVLLALSLAIPGSAQTGTIPLGSYTAVIPQDVRVGNLTFLGGEYQLSLLEGGKYQLGRNDFITLSGTYSVTGNLVEFASPATMDTCSGKGMYQWALAGNRLTLTAATSRVDSCVERIVGLTGAPFFKQDPTSNVWKNIGPTGGQFEAVLIHEGKLYVGSGGGGFFGVNSGGGVFISADNGQTWHSTRGIRAGSVFDLAAFNNTLYAGSNGGRIYFSTDGGENWEQPLLNIASTANVNDFYEFNGRLYAATVGDGVWRLGDSPYKWEKLGTAGLTNQRVWALAASGTNLFAGTEGGVFLSTDGGATWVARSNGMTYSVIQALAVDGGKIYAGTRQGTPTTNEVWVSEDNALNWRKLGNGLAADFPAGSANRIYELTVSGGKLFAAGTSGVMLFDGAKWSTAYKGSIVADFYSLAASGNSLYAGSAYHGIARSMDGGASWGLVNTGLTGCQAYAVHKENGVLYAGTNNGVLISRDEGQSWTQPDSALVSFYSFFSFDSKVYVGTNTGVYATSNQGQTWTRLSTGVPAGNTFRLVAVGNVLYANVMGSATSGGVYRSTDGGQNWTAANTGLSTLLVFDLAVNGTTLFAATLGGGVFRSTDGGQNWTAVNNGLPALTAVAIAAINNTVVVAMTGQTIYRSTDNGQSWTRPDSGILVTGSPWFLESRGGILYSSAGQAYGVMRSTDEGRSWQYVNAGFDARWSVRLFADSGRLYAATPNGVYVSNSLVNRASTVSAASFNPTIADKTIVSAFGLNLATRMASASNVPLPANLADTTVKVRDSLGVERLAPLFFVSREQINYQIPAGTATGAATITIINADGIGATGEFNVVAAAPGIFTASSNGTGAALAVDALTGAAGPFNATQANGQPNIIAVFGTGLGTDATDLDGNVNTNVQATIGGRAATMLYAGRAPGFTGLNQFNITLPTGLTSGTQTLVITRGGVASNAVTITIK